MDLFIAAVVLRHPALIDDRLEADMELAESITDASSAILRRLQVDGWEAFRVHTKKIENLLTIGEGAEYIGTTMTTFRQVVEQYNIRPAFTMSNENRLWRKDDLAPYIAQPAAGPAKDPK